MNIMGIRKVIKAPNYVNVYDLRVQGRIKKKIIVFQSQHQNRLILELW